MNKRIAKTSILLISSIIGLASCSGAGGNGGGNGSKKEINMWTGFGAAMTTALEATLTQYNTAHPEFTIIHTGQGGYDNLLANIVGSVSTRTYPQLAVAYPDHMAQYQESSILFDLTNSLTTLGIDKNNYYQNYLQENLEIVDDKVMGLPFNKSTEVLTTNTSFVEVLIEMTKNKTGDDKISGVPATWQDMEKFGVAARAILKEKGAYNKVIGADGNVYATPVAAEQAGTTVKVDLQTVDENTFRVVSYDSQANFFITAVRQRGGVYTTIETLPNGKKQGYMNYKSQETVTMLKFFNRLFREKLIGIPATFGEASYTSTPFKAFKTIFTIGSSAGVSNCVPADDLFKVDVNPIPYNADKPANKYVISQGTNLVMFKNSDAESREYTLNLLKALSYDAETNAQFCKASGYIPVTRLAYQSSTYQNYLNDSTLTGTADLMRDAVKLNFDTYQGASAGWTQYVDPGFVGSSSIRQNIGTVMAECENVSEANAASDDYWLSMLEEYYRLNPNNVK